ncbi:MAG: biotin--[acetyl-CoA-carboxylase] ligase [Candidatus Nitrosocosmicus sp.]
MFKIFVSDKNNFTLICKIIASLDGNPFFKEFYYLDKLSSTQDYACKIKKMRKKIYPSVVICNTQFRGRGRKGNYWSSNHGGIWMSIMFETDLKIENLFIFVMICAVCICETIEKETDLRAQLKWPNDIFIRGKKNAGFIVDVEPLGDKYCIIIGIGINTNNDLRTTINEIHDKDSLHYGITTLKEELNDVQVSNDKLISRLLNNLNVFFIGIESGSIDYNIIFELYKKRIMESKNHLNYAFRNSEDKEFEGEIIGLSFNGSLFVKDLQQNRTIHISSSYSVNLK